MTWQGICGHDEVVEQFRRAIGRGRLASSFLFVGPAGLGKRCFALKLAQTLLCQNRPEEMLDPCGTCRGCVQVAARTHPDLDLVDRPKDKAFIPLELLIGDKEHRRREGLCRRIALKPYMGGRKIAVIDDADHLNPEGANCLLKTLEEPPPRSVLILIGTSPAKQLPTIRSRCVLVRFRPLPLDVVARLLLSQELVADADEARRLAPYCDGSMQRAVELADHRLWEFRNMLYESLAQPVVQTVLLANSVSAFVDEAGKAAAARRQRLRHVVTCATEFYRGLLHATNGAALTGDAELCRYVRQAMTRHPGCTQTADARLQRCLQAAEQIDRNANQATLIETWLDDLARMGT